MRRGQGGLAAIAFVALLLFVMSLALLWSGRGLLFTQKAAANQSRQALAFAAAESGLAWAEARLNDGRAIDERCGATATGPTYRDRHAAPWVASPSDGVSPEAAAGYEPPPGPRALCRIDPLGIDCRCPARPVGSREAVELDAAPGARFSVELAAVTGDPRSLWIVSRACSGAWSACGAGLADEAQAVVRARLRLVERQPNGDRAAALRRDPLVLVPASWRDGRCLAASMLEPCGFEP
ncbi:MAG TPA: hypothetical protein VFR90_00270 [Methylibium sp.]|uniref:pilus assembly PilX family protein n=1 Tax=Methylibium sp. TaxID=2067992 RepID=UPI002DB6C342|nr:hypothetical protein [Methylibium sp.]HEU4457539.1 hypothetical protein [Methylibium sp.]